VNQYVIAAKNSNPVSQLKNIEDLIFDFEMTTKYGISENHAINDSLSLKEAARRTTDKNISISRL
jgi:hypothetical protein